MSTRLVLIISGWAMIVVAGFLALALGASAVITLGSGMVTDTDLGVMAYNMAATAWPAAAAAVLLWASGEALRRMGTRRAE